jgi:hypothetical protein
MGSHRSHGISDVCFNLGRRFRPDLKRAQLLCHQLQLKICAKFYSGALGRRAMPVSRSGSAQRLNTTLRGLWIFRHEDLLRTGKRRDENEGWRRGLTNF